MDLKARGISPVRGVEVVVWEICSMGSGARQKPERLATKLKEIRLNLGLSQGGMVKHLGLDAYMGRERISAFEKEGADAREPDLITLKAYANVAGVSVDDLIDDDVDLPKNLTAGAHTRGLRGKPQKRQSQAAVNRITVTLRLDIESDSDVARDEDLARKDIEKSHLRQYGMKKLGDRDYELTMSYEDDEDLDERIYALLGLIMREARRRKCNIKVSVREKGTTRYW
jgi:transcriptional regulator with XRE-family HTH domain